MQQIFHRSVPRLVDGGLVEWREGISTAKGGKEKLFLRRRAAKLSKLASRIRPASSKKCEGEDMDPRMAFWANLTMAANWKGEDDFYAACGGGDERVNALRVLLSTLLFLSVGMSAFLMGSEPSDDRRSGQRLAADAELYHGTDRPGLRQNPDDR
ncbi:hypothetical protein [Rhizobium sp. TRM95796]|uniref:hypothetical protein n=1 Tax=Rhizobium sp. TRM95796 TaxID=2979862 RepID=UPI0021E95C32|nr:hypothetical protein [Rhizobium sp. TRM95796]MCV3765572.1 hypothetical protein [Rhizobium sp. TRM95796]